MGTQLNAFQIYILRELNKLPTIFQDFELAKGAWMSGDLTLTEIALNEWEEQLIVEKYVAKKENHFFDTALLYKLDRHSTYAGYKSPSIKIAQKGREYLASLSAIKATRKEDMQTLTNDIANADKGSTSIVTINPPPVLVNEIEKTVTEYLAFLKGSWKHSKIMTKDQHDRLVDYTCHLIKYNAIPPNIIAIHSVNITCGFLRQTFYLLWKHTYYNIDREKFVKFLHKVFQQFKCSPKTTMAKFSQYLDSSNYDTDKSLIE